MTLILLVILTLRFLPVVVRREERVGLGGGVGNLCETETVGDAEGLTIDAGTTDDIDVLVSSQIYPGPLPRYA